MMAQFTQYLLVLACGATFSIAAESSATPPPAVTSPPPAETSPPAKKRVISDDLAASLASSMPKYDPPKPVEKKVVAEEDAEDVDLREVDKPKNGIIRLPKVVVQGQRPGIFRETDFLTRQGLSHFALQKYRGLSMVPFASLNAKVALKMYQEDERLRNMADLNETANDAARAGDTAGSEYIRKQTSETFMRQSEPGWSNSYKR